ncbi:lipopolysaccharide biosynthesis protein [Faecalicatena contorta]|uniref:Membrane protein involved in the export of O-antigen and teichoic acid n=1 Tax=Faecalicatena contorta TaxID=39482 RepID=A0A316A1Y7_9FIRM|nr:oligosaccharide flippase family protein [Faecalicatena contorta]PWJ51562.1 O-antigen/teichoic acid export membrane protein [Faecalicatena contorta]SUQ13118.1 Membrane protein involved in the export of O-antigen and teichoic acid [Faecalicatena contorta]
MNVFNSFINKYKKMPAAAKASLWFVICGFVQRGISTITTPIFTRILDTTDYGIYSVFNSWLEIITIIATLRFCYGVYVKGLVKYSEDQDRFSSSLLGLTTCWIGLFFLIYYPFRSFWNGIFGLSTVLMMCMFAIMLSVSAFDFWATRERNLFRYKNLVKLTLAVAILNPSIGVVAVLMMKGSKADARIISLAIIQFVIYIFLYVKIMIKGKTFYNKEYWKYALVFNIPLVPHFLSQFILNHSDRLMINQMVGVSEAGIYSLAYSIAAILSMLNTSIENSLRPWVFQKIKAGESNKIQTVSIGALILVAISNLILIAFAPEIVRIFAPEAYQGAIDVIPPITMGIFFAFIYNIFVDVEMYYAKTRAVMIASTAGAFLNLVLNYIFIQKFGYQAAAYTTLISYMFIAILHYIFMNNVVKKYANNEKIYEVKYIVLISFVFILIGCLFAVLKNHLIIRIVMIGLLGLLVYYDKNRIVSLYKTVKK